MKVDIKHGRPEITVHVLSRPVLWKQVYINVLLNSEVLQVIEDLLSEVIGMRLQWSLKRHRRSIIRTYSDLEC